MIFFKKTLWWIFAYSLVFHSYTSIWKGALTVYTGKVGEITKVGEFTMIFSEMPNMSLPNNNETVTEQNPKMVK